MFFYHWLHQTWKPSKGPITFSIQPTIEPWLITMFDATWGLTNHVLCLCVISFNQGLACEAMAAGKLLWKVRPKHHKFLGLMVGWRCHGVCVCVVLFLCDYSVHGISIKCVLLMSTKAWSHRLWPCQSTQPFAVGMLFRRGCCWPNKTFGCQSISKTIVSTSTFALRGILLCSLVETTYRVIYVMTCDMWFRSHLYENYFTCCHPKTTAYITSIWPATLSGPPRKKLVSTSQRPLCSELMGWDYLI